MPTSVPARPHFTSPIDWIDHLTSELADQILLYEVGHPEGPKVSLRAVEGLGADLGIPIITGKFGDSVGSLRQLGEGLIEEIRETLALPDVDRIQVERVIRELVSQLLAPV